MNRTKLILVLLPALWAAPALAITYGIKYSVHNMGTTGPGTFKSDIETEICKFCHIPHNSAPGKSFLWNRLNSTATFALYTASPTLNFSKNIQISEMSRMCMTCHDGGTAINVLYGSTVSMDTNGNQLGDTWDGPGGMILGEWGPNIGEGAGGPPNPAPGSNLTNDHPISFLYSESAAGDNTIRPVASIDLPLWKGKMECVTCHDPHVNYDGFKGGDPNLRPFLRKSNLSSSLCFTCHIK